MSYPKTRQVFSCTLQDKVFLSALTLLWSSSSSAGDDSAACISQRRDVTPRAVHFQRWAQASTLPYTREVSWDIHRAKNSTLSQFRSVLELISSAWTWVVKLAWRFSQTVDNCCLPFFLYKLKVGLPCVAVQPG